MLSCIIRRPTLGRNFRENWSSQASYDFISRSFSYTAQRQQRLLMAAAVAIDARHRP